METYVELGHLPEPVRLFYQNVADAANLPSSTLFMVSLWILNIPLGVLWRQLPGTTLKHIVGSLLGVFTCLALTGPTGLLVSLVYLLGNLLLIVCLPKSVMVHVVRLSALLGCIGYQCYMMYVAWGTWIMDASLALMPGHHKLLMLAIDLDDGEKTKREREKLPSPIIKRPSFWEMASYLLFFEQVIGGPAINFNYFREAVDGSLYRRYKLDGPPAGRFREILSRLPAIFIAITGTVCGSVFLPVSYMKNASFRALPLLYKYTYIIFSCMFARWKYYFGMILMELGNLAAGLGISGRRSDGTLEYNECVNMHMLEGELSDNIPNFVKHWNIATSKMIVHYIYRRFPREWPAFKNKTVRMFLTRIYVASFHSLYPAYLLFFVLTAGLQAFQTIIGHTPQTYTTASKVTKVIRWVLYTMVGQYIATMYLIMDHNDGLAIFHDTYWFGFIVMLCWGLGVTVYNMAGKPTHPTHLGRTKKAK